MVVDGVQEAGGGAGETTTVGCSFSPGKVHQLSDEKQMFKQRRRRVGEVVWRACYYDVASSAPGRFK